jgi:hypothetical protein
MYAKPSRPERPDIHPVSFGKDRKERALRRDFRLGAAYLQRDFPQQRRPTQAVNGRIVKESE